MTIKVKQGGQYLDPLGVFVKKGGVYSRALGVFGKVASLYGRVDAAPTPERLQLNRIKTALNTAPASLADVPRISLDITYGGQDEVPANLGGYVRHFIGGEGTQGYGSGAAMDLPVVTHMEIRENLGRIWHQGTYNCHDGSRAQWFQINSNYGPGRAGDNSGFFIGFRLRNGQRFSFTTHTYCRGTIVVDGKVSQMWVPQGGYVNVNLGSVGDRIVVLQGGPDMTLADICVEQDAVIEPYNFMVNKLRVNHGGDSYSQGGVDGFMFGEALGLLTGAGHYAGTAIGGTGYSTNNRNFETPNLLEPARFNAMTTGNPDVVWIMMGINDGWPSSNNADANGQLGVVVDTTQAMRDTYVNVRAKLPNALIVVVSGWVPKESDATNPNGKAKLMADAMRATVKAHLGGSWIFMDVNDGSWETSAGTKSPTPRGPWITGNGYVGNPTGQGRADTWVNTDGTHLTEVGFRGVIGIAVSDYKAALASM